MAKKKKKSDKAKSVDVDETTTDVGEHEEPVVPDSDDDADAAAADDERGDAPEADDDVPASDGDGVDYRYWPVEDDHGSITRLLTTAADREVDLHVDGEDEAIGGGSTTMNLVLIVLIIGAMAGGIFQLVRVASPEALAAKKQAREEAEALFLEEQLAKQKKYGVLRIESNPPQAVVIKDGEKLVAELGAAPAPEAPADEKPADGAPADGKAAPADGKAAPADGKAAEAPAAPADVKAAEAPAAPAEGSTARVGMTPMNIMNLDIAKPYSIRLEKDGYEPFEFNVAEHLWTKDPNSGEYKFFKMVEMTPINCEYWFLYNAKKRREMKFEQKADCFTHYEESIAQQVSVTECVCKIPPEGVNPENKPE